LKIKNKILEESNEKLEHNLKYHSKNLISFSKSMSKVKNYNDYAYPKPSREGFRILESFHYPMK